MRGCSVLGDGDTAEPLVFPAYAGMFRLVLAGHGAALRFPRVCGDVPSLPVL